MIFSKFKQALGGRVKKIVSGSAPLSEEVANFYKIAICPLVQGYGTTETTGSSFVQRFDDNFELTQGGVSIHNEAKLFDIPEMNYLTTDKVLINVSLILAGKYAFVETLFLQATSTI